MTYLVDANVLCEPTKPMPNEKVVEWLRTNERDLVVDRLLVERIDVLRAAFRTVRARHPSRSKPL